MDSGEFIVMVAAVEMLSHAGRPSLWAVASFSILLYSAWIRAGAGTGPGRECAALRSDFNAGDSFDILSYQLGSMRRRCRGSSAKTLARRLQDDINM